MSTAMSTAASTRARSIGPWLATAALAVALAAPTTAHAGSGRVVVMPFEGPVRLADDTRAAIVDQVSRSYDLVAPTSWVKARRTAEEQELGAKVWARAAKKAKVDAVVEGKVVRRGKKAALELTVIDAHAGTEVDHTEITLAADGLDERGAERVRRELEELLGWVDGVASTRGIGDADLSDLEDLRDLDGGEDGEQGRKRGRRPDRDPDPDRDRDRDRDRDPDRDPDRDRDRDRDQNASRRPPARDQPGSPRLQLRREPKSSMTLRERSTVIAVPRIPASRASSRALAGSTSSSRSASPTRSP